MPAQLQLSQIILALSCLGAGLGPAQGGEQHRRQNRDDGNDDEQFNESKG